MKPHKKKKVRKTPGDVPKSYEALAELTSSDIVEQLKIGLSKLAPIEMEDSEDAPAEQPIEASNEQSDDSSEASAESAGEQLDPPAA